MKTTIKILLMFMLMAFLASCTKDQSTVEGTVNYTGAISGTSYIAEQSDVVLVAENFDDMWETTTNSEGVYAFENVLDGKYHVYAEITVNGFLYNATSETFWLEGDELRTVNLQLEY